MKKNINICSFILLLLLALVAGNVTAEDTVYVDSSYKIIKPKSLTTQNYSGDNQHQSVNLRLEKPIRVKVLIGDTTPVKGVPVYFEIISTPSKSKKFKLSYDVALTDKYGIAETNIKLGNKEGEYEIIAKIKNSGDNNVLVYKSFARKSSWVFILVIGLIGGLALFLLGMNMMSDGMQKSAGGKMRSILSTLTNNRFVGVGVGAFVTMIIQSSSATTVMLVGFVNSQLMRFSQSIGVILGAAIGTTITAQLIAFKLTDYSLLILGIGFGIQLIAKTSKLKNVGQAILGFGILFFGMHIMSEAMFPLRSYDPFIETLLKLENPILGIVVGALFTALIQSSSAFIGIMIILATQGLLTLEASIPLIFGANIGTAITAILASLNTNREAKKVALAQTLIKILGVVIFIFWIPYFVELIEQISPKSSIDSNNFNVLSEVVPRQIANGHTIFNVVLTLLVLPFTRVLAKGIHKILPKRKEVKKGFETKYIDKKLINTPVLALSVSKQEIIRMGRIVQDMLSDIILPFHTKDGTVIKDIEEKEKEVNFLRDKIKSFLLKVSRVDMPEERVQEAFQMIYTIKELEQIADIISKILIPKAKKWIISNNEFSDEGKKELLDYHLKSQKQVSRAIEVFRDVNLEKAEAMKLKYKKYSSLAIEFERSHYERLKAEVEKSVASSKTHEELLNLLKTMSRHATNIAKILLEWSNKEDNNQLKQ